jgi:hypothetical protein
MGMLQFHGSLGVAQEWCRLPPMRLVIREIHAAAKPAALNEEWFVVENPSDKPFSTAGCAVAVGKGKTPRLRTIGTLDPGFTIQPSERVRVITGNPGKKAHGAVPEAEGVRNYHLFLAAPLLSGPGSVLGLSLHQHELVRATFDPKAPGGVAQSSNGA